MENEEINQPVDNFYFDQIDINPDHINVFCPGGIEHLTGEECILEDFFCFTNGVSPAKIIKDELNNDSLFDEYQNFD